MSDNIVDPNISLRQMQKIKDHLKMVFISAPKSTLQESLDYWYRRAQDMETALKKIESGSECSACSCSCSETASKALRSGKQ